jgi:hemerythrin-like domain-containing protein
MAVKTKTAKQRADGPMRLVATPRYETGRTDVFSTTASHMALLHNVIIRGFNSIYLQAIHVQEADRADFVGYARAWYTMVKAHHDDEEDCLFRKVEEVIGDRSIFTPAYMEYKSILPRLEEYNLYLSSLPSPSRFSGTKLVRLMDAFRQPLEQHLHSEVAAIAAIATHPQVAPLDANSAEIKAINKATSSWSRNATTKAGSTDVIPFILMNMDSTFEGGLWSSWPNMSWAYKWVMLTLGGSWNGGWWLFTSCDVAGKPQRLFALAR